MFIKKSWSKSKDGKKHISYQIARSYRPGKGKNPRTQILATITKLPLPLIQKIELLLKHDDAFILPGLEGFFQDSHSYGAIVALLHLGQQLGMWKALEVLGKRERKLLIGVILNKVLESRSKLGSISWLTKTAYPELAALQGKDLKVNNIYRAMDKLMKHLEK
ncbi:MAG: hypothetical protein D6785_03460, partial [Planctomycetota bacterium]